MFQITLDLTTLTKCQRESLAGFLLTFPTGASQDPETAKIPAFTVTSEEDEQTPEEAFAQIEEEAAPVAAAPSYAATPRPLTIPTTELDKAGLPWDDRIHASSKARTADGSWRRKRGIDDATALKVEAELKAVMGIPAPPAAPAGAPCDYYLDGDNIRQFPSAAGVVPPPLAAPVAVPPPPPPAPIDPAAARQGFVDLIRVASVAIGAKKMTQEELVSLVNAAGVPTLPMLGNRLDLVPQVAASVSALLSVR